jgi:hypothetical protein
LKRKTKLRQPRIRPIAFKVHPEFYNLTEQLRIKLNKKGLKVSQTNISLMIANKLKKRGGIL